MTLDVGQLKNQISRKVSGYQNGYFVTIDSRYSTYDHAIDGDFMRQFSNREVKAVADGLGVYCFGLRYLLKHNSCKVISSIEIGKDTNRLHTHLMLLHHGSEFRTVEQAQCRLIEICSDVMKIDGRSAVELKPFDFRAGWIGYFTKDTQFMKSRYGFVNIDMY